MHKIKYSAKQIPEAGITSVAVCSIPNWASSYATHLKIWNGERHQKLFSDLLPPSPHVTILDSSDPHLPPSPHVTILESSDPHLPPSPHVTIFFFVWFFECEILSNDYSTPFATFCNFPTSTINGSPVALRKLQYKVWCNINDTKNAKVYKAKNKDRRLRSSSQK